ncbi:MAG: hypothetical protein WDW36_002142 [Sanguina aurantia]
MFRGGVGDQRGKRQQQRVPPQQQQRGQQQRQQRGQQQHSGAQKEFADSGQESGLEQTQQAVCKLMSTLGKNSKFVPVGPMFTVCTHLHGLDPHQLPANFLTMLSHQLTSGPGPRYMIMSAAVREPCMELVVDLMQMSGSSSSSSSSSNSSSSSSSIIYG